MARMVRKQIYIEDAQDELLKVRAAALGVTESELIRRGIDGVLGRAVALPRDPEAWERAMTFMEERMKLVVTHGKRTWTRDDLYDGD
ncbi:MAG TPA: hypothetical protein VF902_08395 [Coriobacteriia bacterium]